MLRARLTNCVVLRRSIIPPPELRIRDGKRFDVPTAQAIIGILYARGEFVEVIDSLDYVPGEVKEYIEAAKSIIAR